VICYGVRTVVAVVTDSRHRGRLGFVRHPSLPKIVPGGRRGIARPYSKLCVE
jgi:hypothetical protein